MCFSAPVSYVASGVLALAGIGAMRKAKHKEKMIAIIPLLFAVQQFIEGTQWLTISQGKPSTVLGYLFLVFAFLIWPTYTPLAVYKIEANEKRKNILRYFLYAGILASTALLIIMFLYPLSINSLRLSIDYNLSFPYSVWGVIIYVTIVAGSLLASSRKFFNIFGLAVLLSVALASYFYYATFTSVWCFFAAALSGLIYFYF